MDFLLFLLLSFTLFVRPAELIPALQAIPLFTLMLWISFGVAFPGIQRRLQPAQLRRDPITICVVLLLLTCPLLSHLSRLNLYYARQDAFVLRDVAIYYLITIAVLNSPGRLRTFVNCIPIFAAIAVGACMLQYYQYIDLPTLAFVNEKDVDSTTGEVLLVPRLRATGIFMDPNDLAMLCVLMITFCLFTLADKQLGVIRLAWLGPLTLFFKAIFMTQSRGGLMALVAAAGGLFYARFGVWKSAILGSLLLPSLVLLAGGRQLSIGGGMDEGTGQARVELWSMGLHAMKSRPLFGIGYKMYAEECTQVAHNSFVHCYVELGLYGGLLFFGAFWFAVRSVLAVGRKDSLHRQLMRNDTLRRLQPALLGGLCGYWMSMMSLSRAYIIPTYMLLGIISSYVRAVQGPAWPAIIPADSRQWVRLTFAGMAFLGLIYLFIRVGFR